jgi:predicted small secreted protein
MKTFLGIVVLLCILGLSAGCHSGTMRGVGSDVSNLGNSMQK